MAIASEIIANTPTVVLQAGPGQTLAVITMYFTNHDTVTDESLDIYITPSGESVDNENVIAKSVDLTTTNTLAYNDRILLENGESVVATCANGTVNAVVSYTVV